jgi:Uma2 family endonuclease
MTPAGFGHGAIVANVTGPLIQHVKAGNLGVVCGAETGFRVGSNPDTVLAPDVAFVLRERLPSSGAPAGYWPGAPDLAVEVLSPSDKVFDVDAKVAAWLEAGTLAVWVVNPHRRVVTIHRAGAEPRTLSDSDTLAGDDIVAGFRLAVADIFIV